MVWHRPCDILPVGCVVWHRPCDILPVGCVVWHRPCDILPVGCVVWHRPCDILPVGCVVWHRPCDILPVGCVVWHRPCDILPVGCVDITLSGLEELCLYKLKMTILTLNEHIHILNDSPVKVLLVCLYLGISFVWSICYSLVGLFSDRNT